MLSIALIAAVACGGDDEGSSDSDSGGSAEPAAAATTAPAATKAPAPTAVSYTHLTLPTNREV